MRKFAGTTTPRQSKAAAIRFDRSPLAAKKLAATRITTRARNAIGSRNDRRGAGQPALNLRADRRARSTCARQSACATASWLLAAMRSATVVAGQSQDQQWEGQCYDRDCEHEQANGAGKRR